MRTAILLLSFLGAIAPAQGDPVVIASPDHAQTFAYGEMIWHQLAIDPATPALVARITFSNLPYVGGNDPRVDEPFDFRFPGAHVDRTTQTIFLRDRRGQQIRVAHFCGDPSNGWVDLTPEAKIYLLKESGRVTAILTATSEPRRGMRWIQMDDNWSLQNLVTRLCKG